MALETRDKTKVDSYLDSFIIKYESEDLGSRACVAIDDTIMQRGHKAAAGSSILKDFVSPIDATVVTKIETAGIRIAGRTRMDEFGISGLFGEPGNYSGAVGAVAGGLADYALVNDYTGAIGGQAAAAGLCCIRPTYGTVSRYGLIPAVASMDQIGIVARTPDVGFSLLKIIAGHDEKDGAMLPHKDENSAMTNDRAWDNGVGACSSGDNALLLNGVNSSNLRIGAPINLLPEGNNHATAEVAGEFGNCSALVEFELMFPDVYSQVMQILCCAEFGSNISRYDGIKFGYRAEGYANLHELYTKSRTEAFGTDTKLAALVGAMVLSRNNYTRYYDKAMRIRRLIMSSLDWSVYDAVLLAANAGHYTDNQKLGFRALPRLCGFPAVTFRYRGMEAMLVAGPGKEDVLSALLREVGI